MTLKYRDSAPLSYGQNNSIFLEVVVVAVVVCFFSFVVVVAAAVFVVFIRTTWILD